jgi:phospholipid/cholesterol/gamma-HCH transport system substrate-binding protein
MQRNVLETVMGAVVLLAAAAFLFIIYSASGVKEASGGYHLKMRLDQGGSITPGTDVRAAGVKVGTVVNQEFDEKAFQAVITLDIESRVQLPTDSSANVDQDGLLGNSYVNLQLGSDDTVMKDGDTFKYSTGALSLGKIIGMAISGGGDKKEGGDGAGTTP